MGPDETHRLALALESLKGLMEAGFATVRGDINLLSRGEHRNTERIENLESDVDKLKERRFPIQLIGSVCVVGSLALSVFSVFVGR
jgi:hypothetical protein